MKKTASERMADRYNILENKVAKLTKQKEKLVELIRNIICELQSDDRFVRNTYESELALQLDEDLNKVLE